MEAYPIKPARTGLPEPETRILFVEDEFLIRLAICEELRASSYHVIEAANAEEAIAILKSSSHIDLIMTDVRMPGAIDGLGLVAWVRRLHPKLPVIITSGHLPRGSTFDEATTFLPKPYGTLEALRLIEKRLEQ